MDSVDAQLAQTARAIATNMDALLSASGDEGGNCAQRMPDAALSRASGVHRDKIRALREAGNEGEAVNFELSTLCKIAAATGVPPAFLLMSGDDWQALLAGIAGLHSGALASFEDRLRNTKGPEKAEIGLSIAYALGHRPERIPDDLNAEIHLRKQREVDARNKGRSRSILAMTAIAQSGVRYPKDLLPLTALGAQIGASRKSLTEGNSE